MEWGETGIAGSAGSADRDTAKVVAEEEEKGDKH